MLKLLCKCSFVLFYSQVLKAFCMWSVSGGSYLVVCPGPRSFKHNAVPRQFLSMFPMAEKLQRTSKTKATLQPP